MDSGCTHNFLSRMVFNRLPAQARQQIVYGETVVAITDSSGLHIYRIIGLLDLACRISDKAILKMKFLSRHNCSVACDERLLVMGGKTILCTN